MADYQKFALMKCIYDHESQCRIIDEILNMYINDFEQDPLKLDREGYHNRLAIKCAKEFAQVALIMKHYSFAEEKEWRLVGGVIGSQDPNIAFRASPKGIIPFYKFKLANDAFPNLAQRDETNLVVRLGPCVDRDNRLMGMQFMLYKYLGPYGIAIGHSDIPYKTW